MNMFMVYKQGVYRHEIFGVFSTPELAKKAATNGALNEYDGYHTFTVAKIELDKCEEDITDLFGVSSRNHKRIPWEQQDKKNYDPRPLSRDIVVLNDNGDIIEILIQMTHEMEIIK